MPQFDISTLPAQELRQLLDSARQRGQAAQSYEILQEMATRRVRGEPTAPKRLRRRRAPDPRLIVLDLGDPLERVEDEELDETFLVGEEPPLTLGEPTSERQAPPAPARVRQRWGHWATLCFALGLGGGVAGGWWAADGGQWERPALPQTAPPTHAAVRQPLPVVVAETHAMEVAATAAVPTVPAAPTGDGPAKPQQVANAAPASGVETASDSDREAPKEAEAAVTTAVATEGAGCSHETTPADRTICAAPGLRRLQAELRQAYAAALEAHENRALLRQRELAWRDGRNAVADPEQLAGLYRQRIAQLKAATMDAERQRGAATHGTRPRQASNPGRGLGA